MTKSLISTAAALLAVVALPAFAEGHSTGDAAAGEAAFNKQCVACHVVVNEAGETLAGRKAKTGPNLYAIAGSKAGDVADFRFGKDMIAAGEEHGVVWDEENFVAYVMDPTGFLREANGDSKARAKMSFKVRKEEDAANIYAYLVSLAPAN